jgi:hypothetical protein
MGESLDRLSAACTRAVAVLWRCGDTLSRAPMWGWQGNPPAGPRGCGSLPLGATQSLHATRQAAWPRLTTRQASLLQHSAPKLRGCGTPPWGHAVAATNPPGPRGRGSLPVRPRSCGTPPLGATQSMHATRQGHAVAARCLTGPRGRSSMPHGAPQLRFTASRDCNRSTPPQTPPHPPPPPSHLSAVRRCSRSKRRRTTRCATPANEPRRGGDHQGGGGM